MQKKGFTLIELLVVIAIIALLLSIMLPSLRLVKEKGQNMLCQTNQRGIYQAAAAYAADSDNRNFDRKKEVLYKLNEIRRINSSGTLVFDMRQSFSSYFGDQSDIFSCPMTRSQIDLSTSDARMIDSSYGFFTAVEFGKEKNIRFGDPIVYQGRKFYVMVGDWMAFSRTRQGVHSSHLGKNNNMVLQEEDSSDFAYARYQDLTTNEFGQQTYNFVYLDGSVRVFKIDQRDFQKDGSGNYFVSSDSFTLYDLPPFNPRAEAHGVPEWMTLVPFGK